MAKKIVTKKQAIILLLLYIFRFVNSKQLQEFLRHKDHRRINAWLKDLTTKEYIVRDFTPQFGRMTKPAIYSLSVKGRKYLRGSFPSFPTNYMQRIARDQKASKAFRIKCQIIADWYLASFPAPGNNQKTGKQLLSSKTKHIKKDMTTTKLSTSIAIVDSVIHDFSPNSQRVEKIPRNILQFFTPASFPSFVLLPLIKPDVYVRLRTTNGITHGLLFVIDSYIPRFLLRYTLKRIFTTLADTNWEDQTMYQLHVNMLCPNNNIIIYLRKLLPTFMNHYYARVSLTFFFATRNQLYKKKREQGTSIKWITISSFDT